MPRPAEAPAPIRFTLGRVGLDAYAQILLAVALAFFVLGKTRHGVGAWGLADPLGPVTALEVIEAGILFALCGRIRTTATVAVEEVLIAVLALCLAEALAGPKPAFGLAGLAFAARLRRVPGAGAAVIGVPILAGQATAMSGLLGPLHEASGRLDAAVVRGTLGLFGHAMGGAGARVSAPEGGFAIDVGAWCASSYIVAGVLAGYALILLWRRGRLAWRDLSGAVGLAAFVTLANWARLGPMAFSPEAYLFWHDDLGAQLVALLDGALTCALALRAADAPAARPARQGA